MNMIEDRDAFDECQCGHTWWDHETFGDCDECECIQFEKEDD